MKQIFSGLKEILKQEFNVHLMFIAGVNAAVNSLQLSVQQTAATQTSLVLQLTTLQHTLSYHLALMSKHIAKLSAMERCHQGKNGTAYSTHQHIFLDGHPSRYERFRPLMSKVISLFQNV